jgi:hypothetical protein
MLAWPFASFSSAEERYNYCFTTMMKPDMRSERLLSTVEDCRCHTGQDPQHASSSYSLGLRLGASSVRFCFAASACDFC